eukprot:UN25024
MISCIDELLERFRVVLSRRTNMTQIIGFCIEMFDMSPTAKFDMSCKGKMFFDINKTPRENGIKPNDVITVKFIQIEITVILSLFENSTKIDFPLSVTILDKVTVIADYLISVRGLESDFEYTISRDSKGKKLLDRNLTFHKAKLGPESVVYIRLNRPYGRKGVFQSLDTKNSRT